MALHKFTPGGCRQNCDTSGCCPDAICAGTVSHTFYTLRVYRDAVLVATYTLTKYDLDFGSGVGCAFRAETAGTGICGLSESWGQLQFAKNGSNTQYSVTVNDTQPGTPGSNSYLSKSGVVIGTAPVNCGQTLSGTFDFVQAPCGVHAWTYEVEPGGTLCTAAATNSCCPCENCRLMRDDFNRTAGTDLGANWTETAGQWTLESPSRLATDDTSAITLSTTSASAVGIAVTAKGSTGDKIRLIAGYQDASNYFYAEFTWGTGVIDLYKRSGGTDTLLQTGTGTFPSGGFVRISLCIDGSGVVRAAGGAILVVAVSTAPTGSQFGLGTGGTNSGAVQFTFAEAYVVSATCEACPAIIEHVGCNPPLNNCCQQEDEAYQYEVDLGAGGYVNDNCNNCAAVSGVFVLTRVGSDCTWRYDDDAFCPQTCSAGSPAGSWKLSITLQRGGPDNCRWQVGVLIYVPIGPQESCGNRLTMYFEATDPGTSAACAGTWTIPWQYTTTPGVLPCTGNLPATIGLASI